MIFRELALLIIIMIVWVYGIYTHNRRDHTNKDLVKLPKMISFLLGSFNSSGLVSYVTMFIQIDFLMYVILVSLLNYSLITQMQLYYFLFGFLIVSTILLLAFELYKGRKEG